MKHIDFGSIRGRLAGPGRDPRLMARIVLAVLVVANLAAAIIVLKPWSGSAEDLERQAAAMRQQARQRDAAVARLRSIVSKVETARTDGDRFMDANLLSRRTVSSKLLDDLDQISRKAGIKQREVTFAFEPIEGSDTLSRAVITAAYEGTYADLMQFLNLLDRSPRLLIIESLAATPQPAGLALNVAMKLNAFVRDAGGTALAPGAGPEPSPVAVVRGGQR